MIRRAGPADVPAMERFLASHAATSMFLRGNLAAHGTENRDHRHGTAFYISEDDTGICGMAGITNAGYVMAQAAGAPDGFYAAFASRLAGRSLQGMTGEPAQVADVFAALGCADAAFALRDVQPLYAAEVALLDGKTHKDTGLRRPHADDVGWLAQWFEGHGADTGITVPDGDSAAGIFIENEDARVLVKGETPVAMATFNARADETVQIGGVYVPPKHRGQGFGAEVVLRHLRQAARDGVQKAILFAASDFAARAYERIGFRHIGSYEIALFAKPWEVGA